MKPIVYSTLAILLIASSFAFAAQNRAILLESDPESYAAAPDNDIYTKDLKNSCTIEAWAKPAVEGGERMVFNKEDSWESAVRDGLWQSAMAMEGVGWDWHDSALLVSVDEWHHVAVTWDGENWRQYVDGVEGVAEGRAGKAFADTDSTMKIGRRERGGATHSIFDGLIDEVRISNNIRYDGNYEVPTAGFEPDDNSHAIYHFDELDGKKIKDFSGKAPDLELQGDAELEDVDDNPAAELAVEAGDKLTTIWGRIKRQ